MGSSSLDREPLVVVSNVFEDINKGGAAITDQTIKLAKECGARVIAVAVGDASDLGRTHPLTLAAHPDTPILPSPLTRKPGRWRGLRGLAYSVLALARPLSRRAPEALKAIRESDLVISKGGHVFVERPSARSLLSFWETVFPLVYASRIGVPTVTAPTSVGPFHRGPSRVLNRFVLRRLTYVIPRDPLSTANARTLGIPVERIVELPDIAFRMTRPGANLTAAVCDRFGLRPDGFVAMTVRLPRSSDVRESLKRALIGTGQAVTQIQGVDGVAIVVQAGDRAEVGEVAKRLGSTAVIIGEDLVPEELVALYGAARLTVASRLHSAIFSLVGGTPALVVSIDGTKTEGIYESLGLPREWVVSMSEESLGSLAQRAVTLLTMPAMDVDIHALVSSARQRLDALPRMVEAAMRGTEDRAEVRSRQRRGAS